MRHGFTIISYTIITFFKNFLRMSLFFLFPSPQKNKRKETKRRKGKEKEKEKPIQRLANRFYRPAYLIIITTTSTKRKRKFEKKKNRKNREEKIPPHQESLSRATTAHPAFTHLHASKADPLFYSLPHSLLTCLPASLPPCLPLCSRKVTENCYVKRRRSTCRSCLPSLSEMI